MTTAWGYAVAPSDGSPLFYESWGERGARTPVLLCDGIGCDGYVWRYLRDDLGRSLRAASALSRARPHGGAARSARA